MILIQQNNSNSRGIFLQKDTWKDKLILFPLFVIVATHLEIAGDFSLSGWAFLYRMIAFISLAIYVVLVYGIKEDVTRLTGTIILISTYFLIINGQNVGFFVIMGTVFISLGLIFGFLSSRSLSSKFDFLTRAYLIFNIFGLFLAIALYYATSELIDLHSLVFPFSASRIGEHLGQVRLSGFQIEPGNYANAIFLIVVFRSIINRKIFDYINSFSILTTILTYSAWAPLGILVYFTSSVFEFLVNKKSNKRKIRLFFLYRFFIFLFLFISMLWVISYVVKLDMFQIFNARYGDGYDAGSTEFKREALTAWLGFVDMRLLVGRPMGETFCIGCEAPQDLGTGFNMVFYLGALPTTLLFAIAWANLTRATNFAFSFLVLPLFVTKYFFYDPLYWMVIGVMLFLPQRTSSPATV